MDSEYLKELKSDEDEYFNNVPSIVPNNEINNINPDEEVNLHDAINGNFEVINEGIATPPITRKALMPKTPVKKSKYVSRINEDGSITLQKKRVRRVLAFESPKKIYSNKKDNFPSLKIFHENAEKMKINNIREMTPEEKALHFSMEPQPIRPSNNWAPHRFNSY